MSAPAPAPPIRREAATAPARTAPPPRRGRRPDRPTPSMLLPTEVALALVSLAAVVGMHRLFVDGSYRGALVLQLMLAHLTVAILRRRSVPLLAAASITLVVGALALAWTRFGDTVSFLVPTGETLRAAGDDIESAWRVFQDVKAPAPVKNGFIVVSGAALWIVALVADWAAFRARAAFEALLPAATLFLFAAALGAPGSRVATAAAFAAASLMFVLLHRTLVQEEWSTWTASHRRQGRWSLLGTGVVLAGVAVLAGAVTGPRLPGADSEGVIAWRDLTKEEPTRVVPSPMIDLRTRIVDQPNVEVFTVRSPVPSYWRLTALDEFDGRLWTSSYGTDGVDGELPRAVHPDITTETVTQTVSIEALGAVWLPAAFEPRRLDAADTPVGWDEDSSTLIVERQLASSDGLVYDVTSTIPRLTDDELRTADPELPDEVADQYLRLPADFPDQVTVLADQIVAGIESPYDRAMAIQQFLRQPPFVYDTAVGAGHSSDALASFLLDTRRGYCEQFAGSFAAMGRAVGLPTRIAIGFTWGARDPEEPTLYRVRGTHAHAWPEVYFEGYGWVPFEPTPGRGPVDGEAWLGVGPQQDAAGGDATLAPTDPAAPNGAPGGEAAPTGDELLGIDDPLADIGVEPGSGTDDTGGGLSDEVRAVGRAIGVGIVAYVVGVPLAIVGRQVVRRRRAASPAAKVRLAWQEMLESAERAGVRVPASFTFGEAARRLARAMPPVAVAVDRTAGILERVDYAEIEPTPDDVATSRQARLAVAAEARRWESWWRAVLRYFDIRELRRRNHRSRLVTQYRAAVRAGR